MKKITAILSTFVLITIGIFGYTRAVELDSASGSGSISILTGGTIKEEPSDIVMRVEPGSSEWKKTDVSFGNYTLEVNEVARYKIFLRNKEERLYPNQPNPIYRLRAKKIVGDGSRLRVKVTQLFDSHKVTVYSGLLSDLTDSSDIISVGYSGDSDVALDVEIELLPVPKVSMFPEDKQIDYGFEIYECVREE